MALLQGDVKLGVIFNALMHAQGRKNFNDALPYEMTIKEFLEYLEEKK